MNYLQYTTTNQYYTFCYLYFSGHANVTSGKVFWLYFGMHYLNDAVWVIGKSVKADLQTGPADIGVSLVIPEGHKQVMRYSILFSFVVTFAHGQYLN